MIRALIAISLFLVFSVGLEGSSMYDQVPMEKEVMGIGENIRVYRDHRGVFYYVDNNGKPTDEPVKLSSEQCRRKHVMGGTYRGCATLYERMQPDYEEKTAAVELQCETRQKWEQSSRYRRYR
jgi:hypothetical protein